VANIYTVFKTNVVAIIKANAGVTGLLANGENSFFQILPDVTQALPCISYHIPTRAPIGQVAPRKNWQVTLTIRIHGTDPDVVDDIDAAFDDMLEAAELTDGTLTDANVMVKDFLETEAVDSDLDPRALARDKISEIRTRTFGCIIVKPPSS